MLCDFTQRPVRTLAPSYLLPLEAPLPSYSTSSSASPPAPAGFDDLSVWARDTNNGVSAKRNLILMLSSKRPMVTARKR